MRKVLSASFHEDFVLLKSAIIVSENLMHQRTEKAMEDGKILQNIGHPESLWIGIAPIIRCSATRAHRAQRQGCLHHQSALMLPAAGERTRRPCVAEPDYSCFSRGCQLHIPGFFTAGSHLSAQVLAMCLDNLASRLSPKVGISADAARLALGDISAT